MALAKIKKQLKSYFAGRQEEKITLELFLGGRPPFH